LVWIKHIHR